MQYWDSKGRLHDTEVKHAPLLDRISNQTKAALTNAHTWLKNSNPNSEDYKQKIGVALGLMTAPIGGSLTLANNIAKPLVPFVGKKIAHAMGTGASSGLVSGGVEGVARGALTGENPLLTGLSDAAFGAITGLTGGTITGTIGKNLARKSLQNNPTARKPPVNLSPKEQFIEEMQGFNLDNYTNGEIKDLRKRAKNFYKETLKPKDAVRDDIGNIKFTNSGIDEQISKGLHNIDVLTELREQIENGVKQPNTRYDYERPDIDQFHIINNKFKDKSMEYQIAEDVNGNRFYFAKHIAEDN